MRRKEYQKRLEEAARSMEGVTTGEARAVQEGLVAKIHSSPMSEIPDLVAGADVSYKRGDRDLFAAVVVWNRLTKKIVEIASVQRRVGFPYVPGFLSFREAPPVLLAFARLEHLPGLLLCDGQGIAHPRRLGLAVHLGILLGIPTVGCAKSRLVGEYEEPGSHRGDWSPLYMGEERVGAVLRTKDRTKPLFVSPGDSMDLDSSLRAVLACHTGYRLPEPLRQAHIAVNAIRRLAST